MGLDPTLRRPNWSSLLNFRTACCGVVGGCSADFANSASLWALLSRAIFKAKASSPGTVVACEVGVLSGEAEAAVVGDTPGKRRRFEHKKILI